MKIRLLLLLVLALPLAVTAQQWELETAVVKMGRVWVGVKANGAKGNFDYRAGFFPNDYDVLGARGQYLDTWGGAGFRLTTTNWVDPIDTLHTVAVYGPTNEFMAHGKVVERLTNYTRFGYPVQVTDFDSLVIEDFGTIDPGAFGDMTCDQLVEVKSENILGVQLHRRVLAWSQSFNDDYVIVDVEFSNVSGDTLEDFYINIESNGKNTLRSNGSNPYPASGERFNLATTWQHYYGGRIGDSLRVFYEYSADNPDIPGDNMGAPVLSQGGRLINTNFAWYSILHASEEPYYTESEDQDDPLQPKVTYIGKANLIPYDDSGDEFGSKNFWAIRGEYSNYFPMDGDTIPGTFHGGNSDEQGSPNYDAHPAGTRQNNDSKMWSSFGPYTFLPDQKIRIVLANGFSGLSMAKSKEVGESWLAGTLEDAPGLPDPVTGYFPENFVYPSESSDLDKIKNRWLSTGVDSVMKSASRALWNFNSGYRIPQAPPPPTKVEITGLGTGVEIRWEDSEAENMTNFAGYRISRRISNVDTVFYEIIYDSGPDDKGSEHLFVDNNVLIGAQYFYFIQAKAQISTADVYASPDTRGKIILSGRALQPNLDSVYPPHFSQDLLSEIAIVPNPYNVSDPLLNDLGWDDNRGIQFFNLPSKARIKIFTENGDLVYTINHDSMVKSGYEYWDMITMNQQEISSGVYIAVFEAGGEVSYQKFIIIR